MRVFSTVVAVILTLGPIITSAQQELTLHFVRDAVQSQTTNPAIRSKYKTSIMLPTVVYNYGNNAFTYDDLIKHDPNSDSTYLDVSGVINQLEDQNILQTQAYTDVLGVYFTVKNSYFTLTLTEKVDFKMKYPKDLISLMWDGNAQFVGETVDIGPAINITYYEEISLNIGHEFEKFNIGTRLKFLNGIANISSVKNSLTLYTAEENFATSLSSDYIINTSGLSNVQSGSYGNMRFKNFGMGIDLGVIYKPNEKWDIAFSALDMGYIKWKDDVVVNTSNGSFNYSGIDVSDFINDSIFDFADYQDTIKSLYFEEKKGGTYTSYLVPKTILSAMYHLNNKTNLGGMLHLEYFDGVQPSASIYAGREFLKFFHLGMSYSYKNKQFNNLGLNLNLGPKAFRFYLSTDNIFNLVNMTTGRNVTFRYGLNINLGSLEAKSSKKKSRESEVKEEIE